MLVSLRDATLAARHLGWSPRVDDRTSAGQDVAAGPDVPSGLDTGVAGVLATSPAGTSRGTAVLGAELRLEAPTTLSAGAYQGILTFTVI